MADLRLEHIYKVYPNGTKAVSDFTMNIENEEFIVFVGPSGCGKSTTLRMIAGLEEISAGELYIDGKIVNEVEPKERDIAMVFQNYALYPHMTVYENMAFGLKLRHVPNNIIHEKVLWAAKVLDLTEYLDRKPKAMSGGQRQRVALGRAILRNPKVMLLDEPLSNLDAKLRTQMRSEISKLHEELKTTFIYVTHDQVEAMTLGTRVVVMKLGKIMQIDTPKNLYDYPENLFVATFIGTPQMNIFQARLTKKESSINVKFEWSDNELSVPQSVLAKVQPQYLNGNKKVYFGLRCEHLSLEPEIVSNSKYLINVRISHFEELGNETLIYGDINMDGNGYNETSTRVIIKGSSNYNLKKGDIVKAAINPSKIQLFDYETENTINPRLPKINELNSLIKNNKLIIGECEFNLPKALKLKEGKYLTRIPVDAIEFTNNGVNVNVLKVENINTIKLANIKFGDELGFAIIEDESNSSINIDFTRVEFIMQNEVVLSPIQEFDRVDAIFMNYLTAKQFVGDKYDQIIKDRVDKVTKEYDEKINKIEQEYKDNVIKFKDIDSKAINEANKASLLIEKEKLIKQIKSIDKDLKNKIEIENSKHKENSKKIEKEVIDAYKNIYDTEINGFAAFKEINKDKEALRKRSIELKEFKENHKLELNNELNKRLNLESIRFETEINSIKSIAKREKESLNKNFEIILANAKNEAYPMIKIKKEYNKQIKKIKNEKQLNVSRASILFFFKIGDLVLLSSDHISNKMIQALGIKVFTKQYYIDIPHNAYKASNDGILIKDKKILDFGNTKFINANFNDGVCDHNLYCKISSSLDENANVIEFDINKVHITEKSMEIKIY